MTSRTNVFNGRQHRKPQTEQTVTEQETQFYVEPPNGAKSDGLEGVWCTDSLSCSHFCTGSGFPLIQKMLIGGDTSTENVEDIFLKGSITYVVQFTL